MNFTTDELSLNLHDIVDSFSIPAVLISSNYKILAANSNYISHYGHAPIGKSCYQVSHNYQQSCDLEGESCPLKKALESGRNQRVLHIHHTRDGEEHVDVALYPVRNQQGETFFIELMNTIKHASPRATDYGLVGKSKAFIAMLEFVNRVAPHDISVLLEGESGSGKELVAHAIHKASNYNVGACVTVECSGLSESLFESELFGHEKGAFTGAINRKKGLVEEATGGTLFLDEIGDVPLSLQVKLLRLIETRTYRRVGNVEQFQADFRLICATNKNLRKMVLNGQFREDLYYRISTFPIQLPALRERKEDLLLLIETLLNKVSPNKKFVVSKEVVNLFKQYDFPGNIRELKNILEWARVMVDGYKIEVNHLPPFLFDQSKQSRIVGDNRPFESMSQLKDEIIIPLQQVENDYLNWVSQHYQGDNRSLAKKLEVGERTLYRKLKNLQSG